MTITSIEIINLMSNNKSLLVELLNSTCRWDIIDPLIRENEVHFKAIETIFTDCLKDNGINIPYNIGFKTGVKYSFHAALSWLFWGTYAQFKFSVETTEFAREQYDKLYNTQLTFEEFLNICHNFLKVIQYLNLPFWQAIHIQYLFKSFLYKSVSFQEDFNTRVADYILEQMLLGNISTKYLNHLATFF